MRRRLKDRANFQGAYYELMVASILIPEGFTLTLEDETEEASKHCEFAAVSKPQPLTRDDVEPQSVARMTRTGHGPGARIASENSMTEYLVSLEREGGGYPVSSSRLYLRVKCTSLSRIFPLTSGDGCGMISATFQLGPVPFGRIRLIITRWISSPPRVCFASFRHSASSQSLLRAGIWSDFFCWAIASARKSRVAPSSFTAQNSPDASMTAMFGQLLL
jgi:hypothetical protein